MKAGVNFFNQAKFRNFADNKSLHLVRLPLKNGYFQLALNRSCLCKGGILGLRFDKSAPKAASAIRSQNISSYCAKKLCQICQVSKTFHQRHCKARNDNGKAFFHFINVILLSEKVLFLAFWQVFQASA